MPSIQKTNSDSSYLKFLKRPDWVEALIRLSLESSLRPPNMGRKWEGEQFIIFNPPSYFGEKSCLLNNEMLISAETKDAMIDRIVFKQSRWLIAALRTRAQSLTICSPSLIKQNYIR